jgi:hypothetical protein
LFSCGIPNSPHFNLLHQFALKGRMLFAIY